MILQKILLPYMKIQLKTILGLQLKSRNGEPKVLSVILAEKDGFSVEDLRKQQNIK